jgi:hypothetical protein
VEISTNEMPQSPFQLANHGSPFFYDSGKQITDATNPRYSTDSSNTRYRTDSRDTLQMAAHMLGNSAA